MKQEFLRPLDTDGHRIVPPVINHNTFSLLLREYMVSNLQHKVRMLSSQLLNAQEDERKRISREIHDGLGQMLSAIKFTLESNFCHKETDTAEREKKLEALLPMIKECIEETRRIQINLRPPILDDLGILATISWFTREFTSTYSSIQVTKRIEIEENEVPRSVKTVIFRVMQEALNNISKYSQASLVTLSLRRVGSRIEFSISDNGLGFDLKEVLPEDGNRKGYGLTSMRERVELSGGSFGIESFIRKGTTIRMEWLVEDEC